MEWILAAFVLKHFVSDFQLQGRYQFLNKGTYGHPGGLLHAGIHGAGTLVICLAFQLPLWLAAADTLIHYHIDWAKSQVNDRLALKPDQRLFWALFDVDQLLHYLTYIALTSIALGALEAAART